MRSNSLPKKAKRRGKLPPPPLSIHGIKIIKHSIGSIFTRCPELAERKKTLRRCLKRARLNNCGGGRYKARITVNGKEYECILHPNSCGIAILVTIYLYVQKGATVMSP